MKVIAVSGTPGTGKTALSKKLSKKFNFFYFDVNKFIKKNKLFEGYDKKRKTKIVDIVKLNKVLIKEIDAIKKKGYFFKKINGGIKLMRMPYWQRQEALKTLKKININKKNIKSKFNKNKIKNYQKINGVVIDSHLSHYLPRKLVDFCIITKCDIKELNKRLKNKNFDKSKIQENLQAEIFDICYNEAIERKHKVIVVNTTKGFNINDIYRKIKTKF